MPSIGALGKILLDKSIDLVGMRTAKHKDLLDSSDGQKLERVRDQGDIAKR